MTKHLSKLPVLILVIGAILRIAGTGTSAIWYDESTLIYQSGIPILSLWNDVTDHAGHLFLQLIMRPLMALSHSLWILRLPSMLAGLVSLWLVWKLMRRLGFTLPQQIAATSFAAFLPGLLWIAQDARSYSLLACLFLAALWFAIEGRWLGLLATCGLMIYTHSTGPAFAVAALIIWLFLYPETRRYRFPLISGIVICAWLPAIIHISNNWVIQQPWQPTLTFDWFLYCSITAIWPIFQSGLFRMAAILVLGFTSIWLLIHIFRTKFGGDIIPLFAWILPLLGLSAASLIVHNNFVLYRTLMPVLFPFALWLGWNLGRRKVANYILAAVWIPMLIAGLVLWHPSDRGAGLDKIANQIRSQWRTGDALIYTSITVGLPFNYYLGDLPHAWDTTLKSPLVAPDSIHHTDTAKFSPIRLWVIIYDDKSQMTAYEQSRLEALVHHQQPVYTVTYIQAAQNDIYLIEDQNDVY
jgi:hypothetical protein